MYYGLDWTSPEVKLFSKVFLKICFFLSPEGSYKKNKSVFLLHNIIAAVVVKCGAKKLERNKSKAVARNTWLEGAYSEVWSNTLLEKI